MNVTILYICNKADFFAEDIYAEVYEQNTCIDYSCNEIMFNTWGCLSDYDFDEVEHASKALFYIDWMVEDNGLSFKFEDIPLYSLFESRVNFDENLFDGIVLGLTSFGKLAIWVCGRNKSVILYFDTEEKSNVTTLLDNHLCLYIKDNKDIVDTTNKWMNQYLYRYSISFDETKGEANQSETNECAIAPIEFDWIEEALYDGTHDKLHDGGLMKYHEAGKPKKWAIQFHRGKTDYTAYFWFEDEKIREVFDRFYGAHPDTKTDFIIRIDAEKKKYELALYRYGLKEPVIIKEDVYQLIVFKNKFEDYRSDNYNQPRGAWIW